MRGNSRRDGFGSLVKRCAIKVDGDIFVEAKD